MRDGGARAFVAAMAVISVTVGCRGDDSSGDASDDRLRAANAACERAGDDVAAGLRYESYGSDDWGAVRDDLVASGVDVPTVWAEKARSETVTRCRFVSDDDASVTDVVIDADGAIFRAPRSSQSTSTERTSTTG